MALKAFFVLALVLAITIGLLLPTPGSDRSHPSHSSIETIELRRG